MTELLAPAGDIKSFDAAIACGANAVYLGLGDFNARMKAENFDAASLREVVKKAHFFGVKVFVTINTIVQNSELNKLFSLVKAAICAKVDAFLVQDLGVCKLLEDRFEGIKLHASTQMGVMNVEGAKIAEEMGLCRAVLARETPLEDVKAISANTSLELEYFVQGALCVSFSGGCYLSGAECGASGNRGQCKQLCRLPYEARLGNFKKQGYLLSARDLCLAESIKELRRAGVSSYKIEGRMRREGYVAKATYTYRQFVFGANDKLSDYDDFCLKTAFSRGEYLKRGYLDGGTPSVIEPRFHGHVGLRIGEVVKARPFKKELCEVTVRTDGFILRDGDGIKLFDGDNEVASLGIGGVRKTGEGLYTFVTAAKASAGLGVNLTLDSALEKQLLEKKRYREANLSLRAVAGQPLMMRAECRLYNFDGEYITVSVEESGDKPLQAAKTAPVGEDMLREMIEKTADTGFIARGSDIETDGVFVPRSEVNALRRRTLQRLCEEIIAVFEKDTPVLRDGCDEVVFSDIPAPEQLTVVTISSEQIAAGERPPREGLISLSPSDYAPEEVGRMLSSLGLGAEDVALKLPALATGKDIARIRETLSAFPGLKTVVANNLWGLALAKEGYRVIAGEGMNIANDLAAAQVAKFGAYAVVPSIEFKRGLSAECAKKYGVKVARGEGDYPLMTFAHCPFKTLFGGGCENCRYSDGLELARGDRVYRVRRVREACCRFELYAK